MIYNQLIGVGCRCAQRRLGYARPMHPGDIEERDGLVNGPARRRGAGINPGNRFEKVRLHVLGEEIRGVLEEGVLRTKPKTQAEIEEAAEAQAQVAALATARESAD